MSYVTIEPCCGVRARGAAVQIDAGCINRGVYDIKAPQKAVDEDAYASLNSVAMVSKRVGRQSYENRCYSHGIILNYSTSISHCSPAFRSFSPALRDINRPFRY